MNKLIIELEKVKNMLETIDHDEATVKQIREAEELCDEIKTFIDIGYVIPDITAEYEAAEGWEQL